MIEFVVPWKTMTEMRSVMFMKKMSFILSLLLFLYVISCVAFAESSVHIYSVASDTAISGQEYVLIIVNGERDILHLEDNDDSILYIQQKTAAEDSISFDNIQPASFQKATAFIISEEGVLVKSKVLDDSPINVIVLPKNIKVIEEEAFEGIFANSIRIPDGLETICDRAFINCPNLTEVYIPSSVNEFGKDIFQGSLKVVIYCYKNSAAEAYAQTFGIPFVVIE